MIDIDDYTQPVESVITAEKRYKLPLEPEAVRELWNVWKSINRPAMEYLERQAMEVDWQG